MYLLEAKIIRSVIFMMSNASFRFISDVLSNCFRLHALTMNFATCQIQNIYFYQLSVPHIDGFIDPGRANYGTKFNQLGAVFGYLIKRFLNVIMVVFFGR